MVDSYLALIGFVLGANVGSFLNCLIYRMEIGKVKTKEFLLGRSFCPDCKHDLSWIDLVPVVSYVLLKGRCRYCNKAISLQYPFVEIFTGLLFLFLFLSVGSDFLGVRFIDLFYYLAIGSIFVFVFVYDLKHYIIPDSAIIAGVIVSVLYNLQFVLNGEIMRLVFLLVSSVAASLFFLIIVLVTKGKGMGMGDVKLAFLLGLFLGWPNIVVSLFLAIFIGALYGVILIISGKKKLSSEIPFGPFLVTGSLLAFFFGEPIIKLYLYYL